jgi:photosystem II stability/assembly factor-like uncharacterized protein
VVPVFVCTRDDRLIRIDDQTRVLDGAGAQCVAASGDRVLVGTRTGVMLSDDAGATWERIGLAEQTVFSVAISAADGALYAGTEPSRLFVSHDGASWSELEALQEIPSRDTWSFPPRPWTHHVRWVAPDPHHAQHLLVGIELGGLMASDDGGATFADHAPGAKRDVHQIGWHPSADGYAYMAAGDGAAWTGDGGRTWRAVDGRRDLPYCWALAVDPTDPERWYVSAASGPGAAHSGSSARGRLYRWDGTWRALSLPSESMPYALVARDGELIAGMSDGHVLRSGDRGETWEALGAPVGSVSAMA